MHVVLAAERFDAFYKPARCRQHSSRTLHSRFNDDCTDFWVMLCQRRFKVLQAIHIARRRLFSERATVAVGIESLVRLEQQGLEYLVKQIHATETHRSNRVTMIGIGKRNERL